MKVRAFGVTAGLLLSETKVEHFIFKKIIAVMLYQIYPCQRTPIRAFGRHPFSEPPNEGVFAFSLCADQYLRIYLPA